MADLPIPFMGAMVRALLDGRKTQTRRVGWRLRRFGKVIEFGRSDTPGFDWHFRDSAMRWHDLRHTELLHALPHRAGDRLYVREAWRTLHTWDGLAPRHLANDRSKITYEADPENRNELWAFGKFRQGMHMPRWASRLTLTVTDVRVERLQEISERDAKAEGLEHRLDWLPQWRGSTDLPWRSEFPRDAFRDLWDSLNAPRGFGWDVNPWVVAVSFTVERRNIDEAQP